MKKAKILIIEDEALTVMQFCNELKHLGHDAFYAVSGDEAVKIAEERKPDIVLLDIRISGKMDGIQAAEIILSKKIIPVVIITGFPINEIKERTRHISPVAFFEKPVNINEIKKIIEVLPE
jgi:two-component system, response regulator PdtaR